MVFGSNFLAFSLMFSWQFHWLLLWAFFQPQSSYFWAELSLTNLLRTFLIFSKFQPDLLIKDLLIKRHECISLECVFYKRQQIEATVSTKAKMQNWIYVEFFLIPFENTWMVLMEGSEKGLDLGSRSIISDLDLIGI